MAPAKLDCTIETSQPKECVIPENDLSPRSDPYFYIKLNLRLLTHLRSPNLAPKRICTRHIEHTTFDKSSIYAFLRWWYPEIYYHPDTWRFLIGWITDRMDRISRDPINAGAKILPMEVLISFDELIEEVDIEVMPNCPLEGVMIEEGDITEPMCVICYENLNPDIIVAKTPCNHFFHYFCIDEWLRRNETCPMCRSDLPMPDYPFEGSESYSDSEDGDLD